MIGVVLAGGASSRFDGSPKGLLLLGKRPLVVRAADVLCLTCAPVVIEAARGAGYEALGYTTIYAAAEHAGKGPLAGIAAGLDWGRGEARVALAPCDMPNLTRAIYDKLARIEGMGAYARTARGAEPLVAVLNPDIRPMLLEALSNNGVSRTHEVLEAAGVSAVMFDEIGPFDNVNTPDDLERLRRLLPPAADG
jgi:molybdopterin-guanine dinucleotide biosynthesis protein A